MLGRSAPLMIFTPFFFELQLDLTQLVKTYTYVQMPNLHRVLARARVDVLDTVR
jgi:hypothetical protein